MPPGAARAWRRRCALRVPAGACAVRSRAESRARADGGVLRGRIAETFLPDGARRGIPRRAARAAVEPAPHLLVAPVHRVVPGVGIEPTWCRHRGILSPVRLPIPPSRR